MEATSQDSQRESSRFQKAIRGCGKVLWLLIAATVRYSIVATISILLILGSFVVYDIVVGDKVPPVNHLGIKSRERVMAQYNTSGHLTSRKKLNPTECWESIQMSLQILDQVCPESSNWVRSQYVKGKLDWTTECNGTLATFNYQSRVLTINSSMFRLNDGVKASILAHEFRHSRQNFTKFFTSVAACVFHGKVQPHIVEDDARLYEKEVLIAIFL